MAFVNYLYLCLYICTTNAIIINTNYGRIEGEVNPFGINQFKKIPFAKPPTDDLRWKSPQEPDPWTDTLNAKEQPVPACLQGCPPDICPIESEDCLYLNIYAPQDAEDVTVMIWIHGGSFDRGFNDDPQYDPSNLIKNIGDIIIVLPNYRLGILGFLYDNTYDTGLVGQYGFEDQLLAIKWVYENIEYFGGDKDNIVLFGQSSGANSVALHLLYNNEYDYFKAGIMQSPHLQLPLRDPVTWYDVPIQFTNLIGCNAVGLSGSELLDCWRAVDGEAIVDIQSANMDWPGGAFVNDWNFGTVFTPTAKTDMIPNQPIFEWQNGEIETPPFIIGITKDEFFFFIDDRVLPIFGYNELVFFFNSITGNIAITAQVLDFYGITPTQTYTDSYLHDFGNIMNDNWLCSVRNVLSNLGKKPDDIYYYSFDVINEELFEVMWAPRLSKQACYTRNCHFTDVWYTFTPPIYTENNIFDNDTLAIGKQMQILWTNYAKTLNPNDNGIRSSSDSSSDSRSDSSDSDSSNVNGLWPAYTNIQNENNFLRISGVDEFVAKSTFEEDTNFCKFWDQIGYAGNYSLADMSNVDAVSVNDENSNGLDLKSGIMGDDEKHGLNIESIIGIVIGCSFLGLFGVLVCVFVRRNRNGMVVASVSTDDCGTIMNNVEDIIELLNY